MAELRAASVASEPLLMRLMSAYYGNKTDLSLHCDGNSTIALTGAADLILVDDSVRIVQHLRDGHCGRVDIVVDNYCFELFNDLLLARHLLQHQLASVVAIHCKRHPIFVSDALRHDVDELLADLDMASLQGVLVLEDEYWNSQWEWFDSMPNHLNDAFKQVRSL